MLIVLYILASGMTVFHTRMNTHTIRFLILSLLPEFHVNSLEIMHGYHVFQKMVMEAGPGSGIKLSGHTEDPSTPYQTLPGEILLPFLNQIGFIPKEVRHLSPIFGQF